MAHPEAAPRPVPVHNGIDRFFAAVRAGNVPLPAVPFVMGGDPDIEGTEEAVAALYASGARLLEIGVPFSDPTADGPIIQAAGKRALDGGTTPPMVLELAGRVKRRFPDLALILMGYYNPVLAMGAERFAERCREAGADGVIVVDLPTGADPKTAEAFLRRNVHVVRLTAPTTTEARLKKIVAAASGCLYHVAVAGVTGQKSAVYAEVDAAVCRIRRHSGLPVMAGFGVKTGEDVRAVCRAADAAVVGSALVKAMHEGSASAAENARAFWEGLRG
jgi:tryptophan synthase alpha chain